MKISHMVSQFQKRPLLKVLHFLLLEIIFFGLWLYILEYEQLPPADFSQNFLSWMMIAGLVATFFGIGGFVGLFGLFLCFSVAISEILLIQIVNNVDDGLLEALAGSGEASHFLPYIFIFLVFLALASWFGKKYLKGNVYLLIIGTVTFILTLILIPSQGRSVNILFPRWHSSFHEKHVCFDLGYSGAPCMSPSVPDSFWKFGRAVHGLYRNFFGDLLAVFFMNLDTGRDSLSIGNHSLPEEIMGKNKPKVSHLIIVIGESEVTDRMSAYGWHIQTTPELDEAISEKSACIVKHTHASASATRWAVLPSLSFWRPDRQISVMDRKNLVELAHEQNMKTSFFTMQSETGVYTGMAGYVSNHADILFNHFDGIYHDKDHLIPQKYINRNISLLNVFGDFQEELDGKDEYLLPPFSEVLNRWGNEPQLDIFHIEGSHFPYSTRYDKEDELSLPKGDDYDRSVHHTDRLLSELNTIARSKWGDDYIIFYTSDHGENLKKHAHAMPNGLQQYRTPVVFYGPQSYVWCRRAEQLREDNSFYSTNMNKYLISEMLGYQIDPTAIKRDQINDRIWRMEYADDFKNISDD